MSFDYDVYREFCLWFIAFRHKQVSEYGKFDFTREECYDMFIAERKDLFVKEEES